MHVERVLGGCESRKEAFLVRTRTSDASLGIIVLRFRYKLAWDAGAVMVVKGVLASAEGFQVSLSLSCNLR